MSKYPTNSSIKRMPLLQWTCNASRPFKTKFQFSSANQLSTVSIATPLEKNLRQFTFPSVVDERDSQMKRDLVNRGRVPVVLILNHELFCIESYGLCTGAFSYKPKTSLDSFPRLLQHFFLVEGSVTSNGNCSILIQKTKRDYFFTIPKKNWSKNFSSRFYKIS